MLKRVKERNKSKSQNRQSPKTKPLTATSTSNMEQTSADGETANFINSMNDPMVIERVRCTIKHAHVFKLPPRQAASVGWRGADWKEKVWQGSVRVVDRNDMTAVLLFDRSKGEHGSGGGMNSSRNGENIFAVCPIKDGAIERCVDSSRYFVLRIENVSGRHMFIGVAFNERSDAFDFNTALEDARREREFESKSSQQQKDDDEWTASFNTGPRIDYSLKEGQKIHVAVPNSRKTKLDDNFEEGGTEAFANFKLDSPDSTESNEKMSPKPKSECF